MGYESLFSPGEGAGGFNEKTGGVFGGGTSPPRSCRQLTQRCDSREGMGPSGDGFSMVWKRVSRVWKTGRIGD